MTSNQTLKTPVRSELWNKLSQEYDLCIIGGGINGAGIARDATLRGLKVVLIEKKDFAWGTSSRSSKLVHGGFRYLEHFKFGLVMESLRERKVLMNIAPHNVHPLPFYIPVYKGEKPPSLLLRLGLVAYEYLSLGKRIGKRKWYSSKKSLEMFPSLRKEGLKGIGQYYDCNMNDARLCLENILSAIDDGATILNYVEAMRFEKNDDGLITGVGVKDLETDKEFLIKAKVFVNATGPWSDLITHLDNISSKKRLSNAKGVHIITKGVISDNKALAIPLKDGRIIFVIPFRNKYTLIGTTDTFYNEDIDNIICNEDEVEYLLDGYNKFFTGNKLSKDDVISSYAGVRPLVYDEKKGASSSDVSREHKIFRDESGLISIVGGKYTTYRRMSKTITDIVVNVLTLNNNLPKNISECETDTIPLRGGNLPKNQKWDNYFLSKSEEIQKKYGIDSFIANHLLHEYGTMVDKVLLLSNENSNSLNKICEKEPYIYAEVYYSIRYEYCRSLEDFFWLRTFLVLVTDFNESIELVADIFCQELGWNSEILEDEIEEVKKRLKLAQFKYSIDIRNPVSKSLLKKNR